jgi:catechol 2,3-dioxygenase-like lactoylglutathione lyase family enzyme
MTARADRPFQKDEGGQMTRRELIALLGTVAVAPIIPLGAQPATAPIRVTLLSHVGITVADFKRTIDFYQRIFGMTVLTWQGPPTYPTPGESTGVEYPLLGIVTGRRPQLIVLSGERGGTNSSVNHFSLGVEPYDPDAIVKVLEANNVKGRVRLREARPKKSCSTTPTATCFRFRM